VARTGARTRNRELRGSRRPRRPDPRGTFEAIWRAVQEHPDSELIYTDECKLSPSGLIYDVLLKPDWSPSLIEATMYTSHLSVYRRELVVRLGGLRSEYDGAQDFDLALRAATIAERVVHVPTIGYIWRAIPSSTASTLDAKPYGVERQREALLDAANARGLGASVSEGHRQGYWRTRYALPAPPPLLSYVIPTAAGTREVRGERIDLLLNCIASLRAARFYPTWSSLSFTTAI
jgi:hypothetical protein